MILYLDRETYSEDDLTEVGTYKYADTAEDLLLSYAVDDSPATVWDCTAEEMPEDLFDAMGRASEVWAHNAQFDKAIHNGLCQLRLPRIELTRWRCSMALALSHALPGALSDLCMVLKVPEDQAKLKEGRKLVQLFTRPQPGNRKIRRPDRHTHPTEWERFKVYAVQDVVAMRECIKRMPRWNWNESAVAEWHADQRINERGFQVDTELTLAGIRAAETEKARIGVRFRELTQGVVDRPSQRDQFMQMLNRRFDLGLDNTRSDTFLQCLKDETLDPTAAELMRLSIASNKTSTAKYAALHPAVQGDGRFRGGLQFAGASRTRRWAGRMFQPQNLPSRGLPKAELVEQYIETLKTDTHDLFFDDLMRYGAAALRGVVIAPPGKAIFAADLSNIEGRVLAWISGEAWKIKAFREYDAGTGPDLYNITAASILGGDPWKVEKKNRNVFGKVPDLACGYQGGVAGFQTFAKAYNVRMADHWDTIQKQISAMIVAKATENLNKWGRDSQAQLEISETEWLASETCKLAWRARHPATVQFWYGLQDAMKTAINEWGRVIRVGEFIRVGCVKHAGLPWLVVKLPSGRYITYFNPRLIEGSITYEGEAAEDGKTTRHWTRIWTHGGKATGNCFTECAKVLTKRGAIPIAFVQNTDSVWDGVEWVRTDGPVEQGHREVGTWLGTEVTSDHLILAGDSWRPVTRLDACSTHAALSLGLSSVHLPSFAVTPATAALQTVLVSAASRAASVFASFGDSKVFAASDALLKLLPCSHESVPPSSRTNLCGSNGWAGTSIWWHAVATPHTPRTRTTEREAFTFTLAGFSTAKRSCGTLLLCLVGMNRGSIWTDATTTADTSPVTYAWSLASSMPTTDVQTGTWRWTASDFLSASSGGPTAPTGSATAQSPTTWILGARHAKLWKPTGLTKPVYDLLNCGPRNRFTVLTDEGPVVVHNCCQTIARDVLAPALPAAEAAGYTPVLTVHDEIVTEADESADAEGLVRILATNPVWAKGLPLAAAGFRAIRYKKED